MLLIGVASALAQPTSEIPGPADDRRVTAEGWFARPKVTRPKLPDRVPRAFVIPIRGVITPNTVKAVRAAARRCCAEKGELVILDMDTVGGGMSAVLDIAQLLRHELRNAYTVCYVRSRALSAGTVIALACHEIIAAPDAVLGDCAPVVAAGNLSAVEREKIESVLRAELRMSAQANGYDVALVESMVTARYEVWCIRHKRSRELRYVRASEWRGRVQVPGSGVPVAADASGEWELLQVPVRAGQLLTMHAREAVELGFASRIIKPAPDRPLAGVMERYGVVADPVLLASGGLERPVGVLLAAGQPSATLEGLYEKARASFQAGSADYEDHARAIVARGAEAVAFLVRRVAEQADRVHDAGQVRASGILVTINLLGRMNSFPEARAALGRLRAHPVAEVGRWAGYALGRTAETQPARPAASTQPTSTEPALRRVVGDRIVTSEGWFARPRVTRPNLPESVARAFVIPIREGITSKTYDAIRRKALRCRAAGAELVVLDMDTFGGEVGAALNICRLLKVDLEDIYVVCYVRTRAISAGAMIALACDEIVMTPTGKLGDCAPIAIGGTLEGVLREKVESPLRTEFEESAKKNGYSVALALSMVSYDLEVWLVRQRITGELRYGLKADWQGRVAVPPGVATVPSDSTADWEIVKVVVARGKLLTMDPELAVRYGFASRRVKSPRDRPLSGLLEHFNVQGEATVLRDNWSELLVEFLTHPAVLGFLVFAAILCAYVEMHTPGFGVAGSVALVCMAIIFGSRFLTGLANWWEIALFLVGVILLVIEIFVTPGFGVMGTLGVIFCIVGLLAMLVANPPDKVPWPTGPLDWSVLTNGILALALGFLAAIVGCAVTARYLPEVPLAGRLLLSPPALGKVSPAGEAAAILQVRPGQLGRVIQTCRPVGKIQIGETLVDAVADGAFLPAGTDVVVLRNEGNRVVVQKKS